MASELNNYWNIIIDKNFNEKHEKKFTSEISTQTDLNASAIEYNLKNYDHQVPGTNQVNLENVIKKSDREESVDPSQKCPICLDAWTDSGNHRLCALRCGHMFGYKCIKQWINSNNRLSRRCPQCKAKASNRHIRFLYTNKVSSRKYFKFKKMKKQLIQACHTKLLIRKALMKQKQKTKKYKKLYKNNILAVTADSDFCFLNWMVKLSKYLLTKNIDIV